MSVRVINSGKNVSINIYRPDFQCAMLEFENTYFTLFPLGGVYIGFNIYDILFITLGYIPVFKYFMKYCFSMGNRVPCGP